MGMAILWVGAMDLIGHHRKNILSRGSLYVNKFHLDRVRVLLLGQYDMVRWWWFKISI